MCEQKRELHKPCPIARCQVPLPARSIPSPGPSFGTYLPMKRNVKQQKKKADPDLCGGKPNLPTRPISTPTGTGSTTGPGMLMRNPVWIGPEAGIRCSADQCSKMWLFLRDHLPRPDPVNKVAHHFLHLLRAVLDFFVCTVVYLDARNMFCSP